MLNSPSFIAQDYYDWIDAFTFLRKTLLFIFEFAIMLKCESYALLVSLCGKKGHMRMACNSCD